MEVDDELAEFGVVTSTTARAHWRGGEGSSRAARARPTTPPRVHDAAPGNKMPKPHMGQTEYANKSFGSWGAPF